MCLEEGSLQNLCEQEREEKLCVCVCVCVCGWVCVGVHTRAYVKRRDCVCLLERS